MPKLKKITPSELGDVNESLISWLLQTIRRNRLLADLEEPPAFRQEQLQILLTSIRANRKVRLVQGDFPHHFQLKANAYLYDPTTQTFKESDQ